MYIHSKSLVILAGAVLATVAGAVAIPARLSPPEAVGEDPAPSIVVDSVAVERVDGYETALEFVGRVESARVSEIGFELGGLVQQIFVDEGDRVDQGALLASLDTKRLAAERSVLIAARDESRAQERLAERTDRRVREALTLEAVSAQDADESRQALAARRASTERIEAQIRRLDVDLAKSQLYAPFAGRISHRFLDEGNVVSAGQSIVRLLEAHRLEVRVGVSPRVAGTLVPGQELLARIGGVPHTASIRSVLPERTRGTRTVSLILSLPAGTNGVRDGDLAEVTISQRRDEVGSWLPVSALTEGARGLWNVYVVETSEGPPRVERRPVELLHQSGERAFVRGTIGPGDRVVTSGTPRLVPGQRVQTRDDHDALASRPAGKASVR